MDRCLGSKAVPDALKNATTRGERVFFHDECFRPNVEDVVWLAKVGASGWVVLSSDQRITRNPLERDSLLRAGVAFFGMTPGKATGPRIADTLARSLPQIRRCLRRSHPPVIATVTLSGEVVVKWEAGEKLESARRLKPKTTR